MLKWPRQTSSARKSNEKGHSQKHIHLSLDKSNLRWPTLYCAQYFPLNLLFEYTTTTTTTTTTIIIIIIIIIITITIINILFCYVQYFPFKKFYFSIEWWFLYVIYITGLLLGDPYSRVIRTTPPTRSPKGRRLDIDSWKYMLLLKSFQELKVPSEQRKLISIASVGLFNNAFFTAYVMQDETVTGK